MIVKSHKDHKIIFLKNRKKVLYNRKQFSFLPQNEISFFCPTNSDPIIRDKREEDITHIFSPIKYVGVSELSKTGSPI